ncbi:hypothetical protein SteCoe_2209 [Stentor coeruleus]|uniref:Protein kinase domain-containing protein n=1 Tax=Stentor coeruleus TaxID=5963 RepID=A0A1R2CZY4_9CILI|nr:hypothetical protein SteCoe_2209 [Stentor coeruleus]
MEILNNREFEQESTANNLINSRVGTIKLNNTTYFKKIGKNSLLQEYTIIKSLQSEYTITALNLSQDEKTMILEYCSKGDLSNHLRLTQIEDIIFIFKEMCEIIEYVHSKGYCHLDIKLDNFVISDNNKIKLIDFGHAQKSKYKIKHQLGTIIYNSPERVLGNYDGIKADVFSLGVCLMMMLCGFPPFPGSEEKMRQKIILFNGNPDLYWNSVHDHMAKTYKNFNGLDEEATKLLELLLTEDPEKRPCISEVLQHDFFVI